MTLAWVVYAITVSLLVYVAGIAAEYVCRAFQLSTRGVWAAAMIVATGLPIAAVFPHTPASTAAVSPVLSVPSTEPGVLRTAAEAVGQMSLSRIAPAVRNSQRFDTLIPFIAGGGAVVAISYLAVCVLLLRRERRRMTASELLGTPVLVSRDLGPALLGVLRFRVVVPRWVTQLPEPEQRLILEHEQSHADARDPIVLLGGLIVVALQPWNPGAWLLLSRLRFAIEADCDARVLRRARDVERYGSLLISVYQRSAAAFTPAIAFAERRSQLERRIRRIAGAPPRRTSMITAGCTLAAATAIVVACKAPVPEAQADTLAKHVSVSGGGMCLERGPSPEMLHAFADSKKRGSDKRFIVAMLDEDCNVVRDTTLPYPQDTRDLRGLFQTAFPGARTYRDHALGVMLRKPVLVEFGIVPSAAWGRMHASRDACGFGSRHNDRCAEVGSVLIRRLDGVHAIIAASTRDVWDSTATPVDHYFLVTAMQPLPNDIGQNIRFARLIYQNNAVFVENRATTDLPLLFGPSLSPALDSMPRPMRRIDNVVGIAHYNAPQLSAEDVRDLKPSAKCDGPVGSCYEVRERGRTISFP